MGIEINKSKFISSDYESFEAKLKQNVEVLEALMAQLVLAL